MHFRGNLVALVTPFRNGAIDAPALRAHIERMIAGGVDGLVPCGTTGESPTLTHTEHDEVVAVTVECAGGRVPVVAGTGSNSTAEAVRLTRAAAEAGADGVLSVTPYYNKPSQEGLIAHFTAIADATDLPVMLYDIPGRTGVALEPATTERLAAHPDIRALKVATGRVEDVSALRATTDLALLSGDDVLTLPMMALGAAGVVSVLANLLPGPVSRLTAAAAAGDLATARATHDRLYPLMKAMFLETNPVPVKTALAELDRMAPDLRPPLSPMTGPHREHLRRALQPFTDELGS